MFPMRLKQGLYVSIVFLLLLGFGCSTQETPDQQSNSGQSSISNKLCPIRGNEVNATGKTVQWKGKTIGFCCDECIPTWNELSEDEKTSKLAKAD